MGKLLAVVSFFVLGTYAAGVLGAQDTQACKKRRADKMQECASKSSKSSTRMSNMPMGIANTSKTSRSSMRMPNRPRGISNTSKSSTSFMGMSNVPKSFERTMQMSNSPSRLNTKNVERKCADNKRICDRRNK